jgi:predicted ATPase
MKQMCKHHECEYSVDAKGCAMKHITRTRELLAESKYKAADTMLKYAEEHLKEL